MRDKEESESLRELVPGYRKVRAARGECGKLGSMVSLGHNRAAKGRHQLKMGSWSLTNRTA